MYCLIEKKGTGLFSRPQGPLQVDQRLVRCVMHFFRLFNCSLNLSKCDDFVEMEMSADYDLMKGSRFKINPIHVIIDI